MPLIKHGHEKGLCHIKIHPIHLRGGNGCATYSNCGSCEFPDCMWDETQWARRSLGKQTIVGQEPQENIKNRNTYAGNVNGDVHLD